MLFTSSCFIRKFTYAIDKAENGKLEENNSLISQLMKAKPQESATACAAFSGWFLPGLLFFFMLSFGISRIT